MRAPDLQPGHIIAGRYTVRSMLAHSGATATYAAITVPNRDVAIKLFSPALVQRPELQAALKRAELTILGLAEEVACRVLESGVDAGTGSSFQVTDLVVHPSLAQLVELCPLSIEEAVKAVTGVARALDAAHAQGLAHGSLKPENVFVGPAPHYAVKVSDFGVWAARAAFPSEEAWGRALPWLAPEEALSGAAPSPAGDVFAASLLLFFALTGKSYWRAWQGGAVNRGALEYEMGEAPAAASARAAEDGSPFDPALDRVLARGLSRDPHARFPSVGELVRALARATGSQPLEISAAPPAVSPLVPRGLGSTMLLRPPTGTAPAIPHIPTLPHGVPVQPLPTLTPLMPGVQPSPTLTPLMPSVQPSLLHQTIPLTKAPVPSPSPPPASQVATAPRVPPPRTAVAKVPDASVLLAGEVRALEAPAPKMNSRGMPTMPAIRASAPSLPMVTSPPAVSAAEPTALVPRPKRTGLLLASLFFGVGIAGGAAATVIVATRHGTTAGPVASVVASAGGAASAGRPAGAAGTAPEQAASTVAATSSSAPAVASTASKAIAPADPSMASVIVECHPTCGWVRVDYKLVPNPHDSIAVPPGPHTFAVASPGYQMQTRKLTLKAGQTESVTFQLRLDRPCPKFSAHCP